MKTQNTMKKIILFLMISGRIFSQQNSQLTNKDGSVLHVYAGVAISAFTGAKIYQKTNRPILASIGGFFIGSLAAASKEAIYDNAMHRGTVSKSDAFNTIWGSAIGSLCLRIGIDVKEKQDIKRENFQNLNN